MNTARDTELAHLRARRDRLVEERQKLVDDIDHFNRVHPDREPIPYGLEEIDRLLAEIDGKIAAGSAS